MLKLARSMLIVAAIAVALLLIHAAYSPVLATSPAGKHLIRLHVIANSDSTFDQALKLRVRDEILAQAGELFRSARTEEEAELLLATHLTEVEEVANKVLVQAGADYSARAEVGVYSFPERTYDNLTLPAGRYRALRLILGQGQGANWWCVLFPPLCFVDASTGPAVTPVLAAPRDVQGRPVEVRFKLVEAVGRFSRQARVAEGLVALEKAE
ncbi:MAG: stage II sporulation protein R [bacterium]